MQNLNGDDESFARSRGLRIHPNRANVPPEIRKELGQLALRLNRDYGALFASNPALRKRLGQFLGSVANASAGVLIS
jgi:hypothetical protein